MLRAALPASCIISRISTYQYRRRDSFVFSSETTGDSTADYPGDRIRPPFTGVVNKPHDSRDGYSMHRLGYLQYLEPILTYQ